MNRTKLVLMLVIDSLVRGGAEVLLIGLLPFLRTEFTVIFVTLNDKDEFSAEDTHVDYRYCLQHTNKSFLPRSVIRLKKLIRKHKPSLIHSHLVYSSLIARLACPAHIPFLYSVHGELSKADLPRGSAIRMLERYSVKKNHCVLAVSETALKDYLSITAKPERKFVLPNYIHDEFFKATSFTSHTKNDRLSLVAVGNINGYKNYQYMLDAFQLLKNTPATLDIYGNTNHPLYDGYMRQIKQNKIPVNFKGSRENIADILGSYDLFISSSSHEGFGLSVVEAMAVGLPVLLSDIPVFREITNGNALFFDLHSPETLAARITDIRKGHTDLEELSYRGQETASMYRRSEYEKRLLKIYTQLIANG